MIFEQAKIVDETSVFLTCQQNLENGSKSTKFHEKRVDFEQICSKKRFSERWEAPVFFSLAVVAVRLTVSTFGGHFGFIVGSNLGFYRVKQVLFE